MWKMEKLIEVREFDSITENPAYEKDEHFKYLDTVVFKELVKFIHEFVGKEENADALDCMRISYKRNVGDIITIKNYVGLIQLKSGYQIQILPKICFPSEKEYENADTKKIFLRMLKSMKDFPSKVFNDANLKADRMNLYELFINMYLQEVRHLVKKGIKSSYVRQEENLKYYKGKLLTSQHIKSNMLHKERFYVAYDEFHPNRAENRLVKSTLLKLQHITSSAENAKEIRQLLISFEMVEASTNYGKDFSRVTIDRNTIDYKSLMKWSKVFLFNQSFTTFSGKDTARALLFPMEKVYESYVAQELKKVLTPVGWDVSTQDKGRHLFEKPTHKFALRPDIVCQKDNRVIIMDTKWKRLNTSERENYGISQNDMYQMYAYSKKYNTSEIWMLYPLGKEMKDYKELGKQNAKDFIFESEDNTTVRIHFVDLSTLLGQNEGTNQMNTFEVLRDKMEEIILR